MTLNELVARLIVKLLEYVTVGSPVTIPKYFSLLLLLVCNTPIGSNLALFNLPVATVEWLDGTTGKLLSRTLLLCTAISQRNCIT